MNRKYCPKCGTLLIEMTISDDVYTDDLSLAGWWNAWVCPNDNTQLDREFVTFLPGVDLT